MVKRNENINTEIYIVATRVFKLKLKLRHFQIKENKANYFPENLNYKKC